MVSAKTAHEVTVTVLSWGVKNNVPKSQIVDLLYNIAKISGNKSFRDSVAEMLRLAASET